MDTAKLRSLFEQGWTYDEIADENYRLHHWRPDRSTIVYKRRRLGIPKRNASNVDLIPWDVGSQHNGHRYRRMLTAKAKEMRQEPLTSSEQRLLAMMDDLLHGRGQPLVIGYSPVEGWFLADKLPTDDELIRPPRGRRRPDPFADQYESGWRV